MIKDLVGTYRVVSTRSRDEHGQIVHPPPLGPHPCCLLEITPHRLLAVVADNRPGTMPDGHPRAFASYGGPYTFDGKTLITHVDLTSDPVGVNGQQIRGVAMEGDLIVLSPPKREIGGKMVSWEFLWEKLK
jgi:hypothetical protein